eukprot:gene3710-4915_t
MGYRCVVAFAADEGLQLAEQYRPDAILLDIRLPDRSGLSVLQLLKDNPNTRHIPVHVVSASENAEAALHMGAIGFALKPATRGQLEEVFRKLEDKFTQKIKRLLLANAMTPLAGNKPLVDAIQQHAHAVIGEPVPAVGTPLYTDVRLYVERGIPGVIYGAGPRTVLESHAKRADERLQLEDLRRATKVIARTLSDLLA